MRQRLRTFFLYFLVFTLPIQSIGAVTLRQCAMTQYSLSTGMAAQDAHGEHHDMAAIMQEAEGSAIRIASSDAGTGSDEDCEHMGSPKHSSCGSCSTCCAGSFAPPPFMFLSLTQMPALMLSPQSPSTFVGQVPAPLERPPRTSLSFIF